jgi:hypothetical protein
MKYEEEEKLLQFVWLLLLMLGENAQGFLFLEMLLHQLVLEWQLEMRVEV